MNFQELVLILQKPEMDIFFHSEKKNYLDIIALFLSVAQIEIQNPVLLYTLDLESFKLWIRQTHPYTTEPLFDVLSNFVDLKNISPIKVENLKSSHNLVLNVSEFIKDRESYPEYIKGIVDVRSTAFLEKFPLPAEAPSVVPAAAPSVVPAAAGGGGNATPLVIDPVTVNPIVTNPISVDTGSVTSTSANTVSTDTKAGNSNSVGFFSMLYGFGVNNPVLAGCTVIVVVVGGVLVFYTVKDYYYNTNDVYNFFCYSYINISKYIENTYKWLWS